MKYHSFGYPMYSDQKLETNHLTHEDLFKKLTSPNMYSSFGPTKDRTYDHISKRLCYLSIMLHHIRETDVLYQCVFYFLFFMISRCNVCTI